MEKLDARTYQFALRTIGLVKELSLTGVGSVLGRQVLRSATSIGANVEEAYRASIRKEFARIMSIAQREACETHYWLRLIRDSALVPEKRIESLVQEGLELKLILSKTVITSRKRQIADAE